MSQLYGAIGATYGAHTSTTYGTLFDNDTPPTSGLVTLFARVTRSDVTADINLTGVSAKVTTLPVTATIN